MPDIPGGIKAWTGAITGIAAVIALLFAFDRHYMTVEAAEATAKQFEQSIYQLRVDQEIAALEAERERKQLRLAFLIEKANRSEAEQQEISYLNQVIPMLDDRLAKLRSVKP